MAAALSTWQLRNVVDGGAVIGPLGDNIAFVWNTWWASHPASLLSLTTPLLFAPWGTSLVLHTHTVLPSFAAAMTGLGPIGGTEVIVALHLALNGLCAFVLAGRVSARPASRAIAAVVFAWSPFIGAHLMGHFNLVAAWVLPLAVFCLLRALDDGAVGWQLATGLVFGLIPYIDYYFFVYACALALLVVGHRVTLVRRRFRGWTRSRRAAMAVIAGLLTLDTAALILILTTGGGTIRVAGAVVSLRGIENPAAAAGLLAMLALAVACVPDLRVSLDRAALARDLRCLSTAAAVALLLIAPLGIGAVSLWRTGGYVSQAYLWRSAPAGIDLGSLLLGNPSGLLWMDAPSRAYAALRIDAVERVAWMGPGVVALVTAAIVSRWRDRRARLWVAVAIVFGIWALGPRVQAFGRDLHVFLPAVLLRYVPLAANARMPGRAMIVVYLAAAVLAAIGFDALLARGRRAMAWTLAALVVLDYLPKTPDIYRPDHPVIYDTLARQSGPGSVCELPMGLRDGFGETGRLDMRTLYYQTLHGRPMTGGFVARLDPRIVRNYEHDPVLGVMLRLSGGGSLAGERTISPDAAAAALQNEGIRFLMLNRGTAPADLVRYVESALPLRTLQEEGERTLYEVVAPVNGTAEPPSR